MNPESRSRGAAPRAYTAHSKTIKDDKYLGNEYLECKWYALGNAVQKFPVTTAAFA